MYSCTYVRLVGDVSLNVNFALSEPSVGAAAVLNQRFQEI